MGRGLTPRARLRRSRRDDDDFSCTSSASSRLDCIAILLAFLALFLFAAIVALDASLTRDQLANGPNGGGAQTPTTTLQIQQEQILATREEISDQPPAATQQQPITHTAARTRESVDTSTKPVAPLPPTPPTPTPPPQPPQTPQPTAAKVSTPSVPTAQQSAPTVVPAPEAPAAPATPAEEPPTPSRTAAKLIPVSAPNAKHTIRTGAAGNYDDFTLLHSAASTEVVVPGTVGSVRSPDGKSELTLFLDVAGVMGYRVVDVDSSRVLLWDALVDLKVEFRQCLFHLVAKPLKTTVHFQVSHGVSHWEPVGNAFEQSVYESPFTSLETWCEGGSCLQCTWKMEWRLFDRGLGVRAKMRPDLTPEETKSGKLNTDLPEEWVHVHFGLYVGVPQVHQVPGGATTCWWNNLEEAYISDACTEMTSEVMTPITITVPHGDDDGARSSRAGTYFLTQTAGFGFTASMMSYQASMSDARVAMVELLAKGEAIRRPNASMVDVGDLELDHQLGFVTSSSWHVVTWSIDEVDLAEESLSIVRLLAPPTPKHLQPVFKDVANWLRPGKLLRIRSFNNGAAKRMVDFAHQHGYDLLHFDAGWYGDEHDRAAVATDVFKDLASQLDFPTVVKYAHAQVPPIGVSVYVNDIALRETEKLVRRYRQWRLDGIKFGFVDLHNPVSVRTMHMRALAFADAKMFVDVHDYYRPRSFTRTFPHMLTQEGVRGEERVPDCTHHTILPFVRFIAGAADYTPRYVSTNIKCTRAHQLALPLVLFSPIQSLFWSEELAAISEATTNHPELRLWESLPTIWVATRMLAGAIGQFVVTARLSASGVWFVGGVNSDGDARELLVDLAPLFRPTLDDPPSSLPPPPKDGYVVELWADDEWTSASARGDLHRVAVRPATYLYLAIDAVAAALSGSTATQSPPVPDELLEWTKSRDSSVASLTALTVPVQMAPGGGHCMRIRHLQDTIADK